MQVKLVVTRGGNLGQEVPVTREKFFIGRAADCQFRPQSDSVGRHHCAIVVERGFVAVRDFGTTGGTFVNREPVKGQHELKNGDTLKVGDLEFEVRVAVDGKQEPKVESVPQAAPPAVEPGVLAAFDLDSWLTDPAATDAPQTEAAGATAAETAEPEPAEEERKKEKPVKIVGVWEKGNWKPTAVDPRKAASDALKDFFRRR
ncbi:MAG: hypothetical protein A2V98_14150 [Planctomycetes bacterium RBG_16_64_12]|nr:MAG: hypothetical protein A2V98_14150 [Planctomycetes bacterium RBG_16_64_12]